MGLRPSEASLTYARRASRRDMLTRIHELILVLMLTSMRFGASGMRARMGVSVIDWDEIMWALLLTFELAGRWRSHVGTTVGGMISLAAVVVQYGCCESMVRHR